jgi:predicted nucleic acid-binding protein
VPLLYFDTSALIKRYVREVGSDRVDALVVQDDIAVSSLMRVEVASALARRTREGRLTTERRDEIYARFLDDLLGFVVVELDEVVLVRAAVLARTSPADARRERSTLSISHRLSRCLRSSQQLTVLVGPS